MAFVLIASFVVALVSQATSPQTAEALPSDWWNGSWQYRMQINITENSGTTLRNYQVPINLTPTTFNYSRSLVSGGGDLRFTTTSGTLCNYWVETWNTGGTSTIWVAVPNLSASSTTSIYMYYGNSGVTAASNDSAVFDYVDRGDQTASWTVAGTAGQNNSIGNSAPSYYANSSSGSYMYKNISLVPQRIITFNVRSNYLGNLYFLTNATGSGQMYRLDTRASPNRVGFNTTTSWTSWLAPNSTFSAAANQWYKLSIVINASNKAIFYYNQSTDASPANFGTQLGVYTITNNGGYIGLVGDAGGAQYGTWWDNIIVRKYASPAPTVTLGLVWPNEQIVFNSGGTWTVPLGVTSVQVLVVGGGGGGGGAGTSMRAGGGGGAGGVNYSASYAVTSGASIPIIVGANGSGGSGSSAGSNGGASSFNTTLTAAGGGGGGGSGDGNSGGSGGGGGVWMTTTYNPGSASPAGQGNPGGLGYYYYDAGKVKSYYQAGGGGGKNASGSPGSTSSGGAGGVGVNYGAIFGILVGDNGFFAGGGGGGCNQGTGGAGGTGGGGSGASGNNNGNPATVANSGGGGGGAYSSGSSQNGGSGAYGIVIVKYTVWTLTYNAGSGGSINGVSPQTVCGGSSGSTVTAIPATCYHFVNWSDGITTASRTDTNVQNDITVTANFTINTYNLNYSAAANGSISGTANQTVNCYASGSAVTAVPLPCYHFVSWSDGNLNASRTDSNVQANLTVSASFAFNGNYTLTYTAGANGSISGPSPQNVTCNSSGSAVTATPANCYHFVNWSDGNTSNPRRDTNVQANISVIANFAINTYNLTYNAGTGGSISGTQNQTVNCHANGSTVTAMPAFCYHFVNWSDGNLNASRTETNVTANFSVNANFALSGPYTLNYTAGANGSISGSNQTVSCGGSGSAVTAAPNTCYHFVSWSDGNLNASRTDTNVTANLSVAASFAINTYTLNYTADANGSISGTANQTVNCRANGSAVTAIPAPCYHFVSWSDGVMNASRTDTNVTANISATASFAPNGSYTLTYTADANGSITGISPQTVNCGDNGSAVIATPADCYHFVNWSDGNLNASRTDTNVQADITVIANFAINISTLSLTASPTAGGSPRFDGSGSYNCNSTVNIYANTSSCYIFAGWTLADGVDNAGAENTTVLMNVSRSLTASYIVKTFNLSVYANDSLGGSPYFDGTIPFTCGTNASIHANVSPCYTFTGWTGGAVANASAPNTTVRITADTNLTANYVLNTYNLTLTANNSLGGTPSGNGSFTCGTNASIHANTKPDYTFAGWSPTEGIDDPSAENTNVLMNKSRNLTANYIAIPYTIDITAPSAISSWALNIGSNTNTSTLRVTVTPYNANWSVTANDSDTLTSGHMTSWNGTAYNPLIKLFYPMNVSGNYGSVTLPAGGNISKGRGNYSGNVNFTQEVTWNDVPGTYQIVVTFTGTVY